MRTCSQSIRAVAQDRNRKWLSLHGREALSVQLDGYPRTAPFDSIESVLLHVIATAARAGSNREGSDDDRFS